MLKNFMLCVFTAAATAVLTVACSGGDLDQCVKKNVRCEEPLVCDPGDGVCKCGGRGGVICPADFVCDPVANTCLSTKCTKDRRPVDCSAQAGTSCDVNDGACKCGGTGGTVCGANEVCDPTRKACTPQQSCSAQTCPVNQTCNAATGRCACGASPCGSGMTCTLVNGAPTCTADQCSGVSCTGSFVGDGGVREGNVCSAAEGMCQCNGVVCSQGQACACPPGSDAGCAQTARACRASSLCSEVTCTGGMRCDYADGICKCGGPGGVACAANQICNLGPPPQCQGGQQCTLPDGGARQCASGTSCDPEDGRCKCGGRGGQLCAAAVVVDGGAGTPAEVCVLSAVQTSCKAPCDPRLASADCPMGQFCYFDSSAATPVAYCAAAPTSPKPVGDGCTSATACFASGKSLHCNGLVLGSTGICRSYCDVASGSSGCIQVPTAQNCVQILGAPAGYGYCQSTQ